MVLAFKRALLLFAMMWLSVGSISIAQADNIMRVRAFSNSDKTRVVLDLDYKPVYSTAIAENGNQFIIRLNDVSNYKTATDKLAVDNRSVIKGFQKNLSGDDVRYIFSLKGSGTPNVFVLDPMDGRNYRLVIDFPHTANERQPSSKEEVKVLSQTAAEKLAGTGQGAGTPPVKVITIKDADEAENALLNSLSSVGSDGIRTMTPAQVKEYHDRVEQINAQQAAQKAAAEKNKNNQTAQKKPSKVEEVVLDTQAPPPPTQVALPSANPYIIAIDAGHGGKDPGALGKRGVREKDVTLAIAMQLEKYVNSNPRFRGRLIRNKDVFVDLDKRSEIARSYKADILISIHADSVASGSSARGASVWVLSNNRAQRENNKVLSGNKGQLLSGVGEVLSSSSDKQNPYLAATILSMTSDNTRSEGYNMGQEILNKLGKFTKLHKKTPIHASLAVLKSPDIPSLLIETGFLSNPYEEIQLNQPNYQKQIAYSIYQGIVAYYEKYTIQNIKSRYESAIRTGSAKVVVHTVQKGESLSVIARKYNISLSDLKAHNRLTNNNIRIGQKLVIHN